MSLTVFPQLVAERGSSTRKAISVAPHTEHDSAAFELGSLNAGAKRRRGTWEGSGGAYFPPVFAPCALLIPENSANRVLKSDFISSSRAFHAVNSTFACTSLTRLSRNS